MTPEAIETICRRATLIHARTLNDEAAELAKDVIALCDHIAASKNGEAAPTRHMCEVCGLHEASHNVAILINGAPVAEARRMCAHCAPPAHDLHRANDADPLTDPAFDGCGFI